MNKRFALLFATALLALSACVTINVYFPAAEAEKAASEFIDEVIGGEQSPSEAPSESAPPKLSFSFELISSAHAAADISIATPAIQAIQKRMAERFAATLEKHFDAGALGFRNDGLIELRDASKVALPERAALKQAVADDNRDRDAVYREIAVANGHPEWEAEIRATFASEWIARARKGWYYQDAKGGWVQK
jgi:uncharacterized protein YdbL (DUF1318 family)